MGSMVFAENFKEELETRVVGPCPVFGIHKMYKTGNYSGDYANVYNKTSGSLIAEWYQEYQCECGEYFVCEGTPGIDQNPVGRYFYEGDIFERSINYIPVSGFNVRGWKTYRTSPRGKTTTMQSEIEGYTFYDGTHS
jgi:hypothetical protein